jgi:8-oxo-dGTP diphosphatase
MFPQKQCTAVQAADDAENAEWWSIMEVPKVAFDHKLVLRDCFLRASDLPAARDKGLSKVLKHAAERLNGNWKQ